MQIKHLGLTDYQTVFTDMKQFTDTRDDNTEDELWLTEHNPVFTLGQASKPEHLLQANDIPIVQSDRGGQITYHGPGQAIVYFLIDLKRLKFGVRQFVELVEDGIIQFLQQQQIVATNNPKAPGVYVSQQKIASLGIRIRSGRCYHGVAINVDNDLTPFNYINPCGYQGLQMTSCKQLGLTINCSQTLADLVSLYTVMINSFK